MFSVSDSGKCCSKFEAGKGDWWGREGEGEGGSVCVCKFVAI